MTDVAPADLSLEHKEAELAPSECKHSEDIGKKTPLVPTKEKEEEVTTEKQENSTPQPAPEVQLEKDTTIRPRSPVPEMETVPTPASSPVDEVQPSTKTEDLLDESAVDKTEKPDDGEQKVEKKLPETKKTTTGANSSEFSSFSPLVESAFNTKEEMPKLRKSVSVSKPAPAEKTEQEGDKPSNPWGVQLKHDSRPAEPKTTEVKKEKAPEDTSPKKANPWGVQLKRTGSGIGASNGAASSRIASLAATFGGTNTNVTRKSSSPTKPATTYSSSSNPSSVNEKIAKFGNSNTTSASKGTTAPAGGHIAKLTAAFNSNSVSNATNNTKPTLGRRNSLEMHQQKEREEQEKIRKGNFGLQLRKASGSTPTTPAEPTDAEKPAPEQGSNIFGVKLKKVTAQPELEKDDLPIETPTPEEAADSQHQVAPSSSAEPIASVDEPVEVPVAAQAEVQA